MRELLSLPADVSVFYAFGSPLNRPHDGSGPRSSLMLIDAHVKGWWRDYKRDRKRYRNDPVRRALCRSTAPVIWNHLVPGGRIDKSDDQLWETVRKHDIRAGLSIPLRDPHRRLHGALAFVGFCSPASFDEWWQDTSFEVIGAAHLFHQGLVDARDRSHLPQLSPREEQCLAHVARGRSSKEIARSLGLSPRTVDLHVARATKRLRAANRIEAATIAVRDGHICTQDEADSPCRDP